MLCLCFHSKIRESNTLKLPCVKKWKEKKKMTAMTAAGKVGRDKKEEGRRRGEKEKDIETRN